MFSLRKTALIGLSVSAIALSGCLSGGGGGGSDDVVTPEPQTPQQERIDDGFFFVADSVVDDFEPISGTETQRFAGELDGAGYRVEIPPNWNGTLVMWAHGFRGEGPELTVDNPPIREHLIAQGYAWAASSYSANFYDVRAGVVDTNKLALAFSDITGAAEPDRFLISGFSMGGHVTGAAIEVENIQALSQVDLDVNYSAALPMCGVMGDTTLFDYFGAYGLSLFQLAGVGPDEYPISAEDAADRLAVARDVLWTDYDANKNADGLTSEGLGLFATLQNLSGGARPIYQFSFGAYQDLLQGFVGTDGTVTGILNDNVVDTTYIRYRFQSPQPGPNMPGNPNEAGLTTAEQGFNSVIAQSIPDNDANPLRNDGPPLIPRINGEFDIPVLTMHGLGDLFVPFSMQQIYRNRAVAAGNGDLLVQRAIRDPNHCGFTSGEIIEAFDDLIAWVDQGITPDGDDIMNPAAVADSSFGCQFSRANRFAGTALAPATACP
ncbi:hypothetical protein [Halopseudomonas salegens]|uniref:Alpha/beta hydrolase n=1 Tax=Halopseudomonas salegens TaxID=1434072 RepID=A0A1H2GBR9_9GAMM|nr:hypothetical protein [Halopseudomonas salegens]SDU17067.1 hypothetical protein SAMN05216210_2190 [Halopseudomonas salegens]